MAEDLKTLIPSRLGLTAEAEQNMVQFFIKRMKYHRELMGYQTDQTYKDESWLWKRYRAGRMHENDFGWRVREGNLFSRVNMSLGLIEQAVTHHWSQITADLIPNHEFFGAEEEGPEDIDPAIALVQRFLQKRCKRQKLPDIMRQGILKAMVYGEAVAKAVQVNRRIEVPVTARPLMQDGAMLRTDTGEPVTELDAWDPNPDNPTQEVLRKFPRMTRPAGLKIAMAERPLKFHQTRLERGAEIKFHHFADFVAQLNCGSLDDSEVTASIFEENPFDLFDRLPKDMIHRKRLRDYLQERRQRLAERGTEQTEKKIWAGEQEDTVYDMEEGSFKTARYAEIYARYSPYKTGRYDRIYMLVDLDLEWPIHYCYANDILTWTDKPHPFHALRIFPSTDDRWYGQGYYHRFFEPANFSDKCWCRIELELQKSGNLLFENPKATEEGNQGLPLTFRSPSTLHLRGDYTKDEALGVVTVTPQVTEIQAMLDANDQRMAASFGITAANDPSLQNMPAADTLGGMEMLQETSNVGVRKRESELLEGLDPAIVAWGEAELKNAKPEEIAEILGEEQAAMVIEWLDRNAATLSDHVTIKTEAMRRAKTLQDNAQVIQILDQWIRVPVPYKEAFREVFAARLKLVGVKDPKSMLINPELAMQEAGASPAQASAAVAGAPDPEAPPQPTPKAK